MRFFYRHSQFVYLSQFRARIPEGAVVVAGHEDGQYSRNSMNSRASIRQFNPAHIAATTRELALTFEQLCRPALEFAPVQAAAFSSLDVRWYDRVTATLRGAGYRPLGDIQENVAIPAELAPGFLRLFVSADGTTNADISHTVQRHQLRLRNFFRNWSWDKGKYSIQFSTEFSDGSFCQTTTEPQLCDVEPGFNVQYLPVMLSVNAIVLRHKQLVLRYLRDRPDLQPLSSPGLREVIDSMNRAQGSRSLLRRERGLFSETELWRLGYAPALASQLAAEMRRQRGPVPDGA